MAHDQERLRAIDGADARPPEQALDLGDTAPQVFEQSDLGPTRNVRRDGKRLGQEWRHGARQAPLFDDQTVVQARLISNVDDAGDARADRCEVAMMAPADAANLLMRVAAEAKHVAVPGEMFPK